MSDEYNRLYSDLDIDEPMTIAEAMEIRSSLMSDPTFRQRFLDGNRAETRAMQALSQKIVDFKGLDAPERSGDLDIVNETLAEFYGQRRALMEDPAWVTKFNSGDPEAVAEMTKINAAITEGNTRAHVATEARFQEAVNSAADNAAIEAPSTETPSTE